MFRNTKTHVKYKKNFIEIRQASIGEEYEVGRWPSCYSWENYGYENKDIESKYSDIIYIMTYKKMVIGYSIACSKINTGENNYIPLYNKELILSDICVEEDYFNDYITILFDYLISYAKYNGYKAISIKSDDQYKEFINFISNHYDLNEYDNTYYIIIDNPRIKHYQKHLMLYGTDKVSIEDIYFLYDLNFNVLKTKCSLKLSDNNYIELDRKTGVLSFSDDIKILKDKVVLNNKTRSLVANIIQMHDLNKVEKMNISFENSNPYYYEATIGNLLYVSKNLYEIREDKEYANSLIKRGYEKVVPNTLNYEMNDSSFSYSKVIYSLVKK